MALGVRNNNEMTIPVIIKKNENNIICTMIREKEKRLFSPSWSGIIRKVYRLGFIPFI
jgi:hypothetical protein|tara:strand:+ start:124 stop:297 length:174 start_codon:yes stop_codon:yes gene_type:complete